MDSISKIKKIYESYKKAKNHFECATNTHTFLEFVKIKNELYLLLDLINISDKNWILTPEKYHKCLKCKYSFYTPEKYMIKYRKIIHDLFECEEILNLQK